MTENTWWTRGATLVERLTPRDSRGNPPVRSAAEPASARAGGGSPAADGSSADGAAANVPAASDVTSAPCESVPSNSLPPESASGPEDPAARRTPAGPHPDPDRAPAGPAPADPHPDFAQADPHADPSSPDDLVARWRADYPSAETFAARLGELDLDEGGLRALLAASPDELAARIERPSWADTAERAWAAAPDRAPAPEPGAAWEAGFAAVLDPFVGNAADDLLAAADRAGAGPVPEPALVRRLFTRHLAAQLVALARRTLVLELNVARVEGRLNGATPELRFADFVRRSGSRDGLRALLTGYPVLARLLAQGCELAVEAWSELLARLAADRAAVVATVFGGADPGPLADVAFGSGDRHRRGRTVAVLTFAGGGRVVLKPRPVSVHAHFNDAAEWLNYRVPELKLRTLRVLERPGYGWVEYVEPESCADVAHVGRFYWRVGALLALVHALGGTDLHVENLIACGDQPVPVDLETLLHPVPARPATGDPARAALEASVRRTALLPSFLVGEHGAVDLSGLGGDQESTLPGEVTGWDAPATDEMRLIRTTGVFPGAANRPRLAGADADPGAYTEDLIAGFRTGYDAIAAHRDELTGDDGLLARFAGDVTRAVVRNTRWYATLLDESTHPAVLRDAVERDRLLDVVWRDGQADPVLRGLVAAELDELWLGDVPLVACRPDSADVAVGGRVIGGVMARAGLPDAVRRLAAMGGIDRHDQEWIIRACLATRRSSQPPADPASPAGPAEGARGPFDAAGRFGAFGGDAPVAADPERLLATAAAIADRVVAAAHESAGRVNWLGVEPLEDRVWAVLPQGAGLPHGYCGTALFLAELGDLTGIGRYSSLARRAVRPLPGLLSSLGGRTDDLAAVGAGFAGLGGIAYALVRLAALLDDQEIHAWVAETVELAAVAAESAAAAGCAPGVTDGDAGCLAAMLAVRQATGSPRALAVARGCADRLAARAPGTLPAGGFDTGASGVGWALLRYAAETGGSPRHAAAGLALLDDERARHATVQPRAGWSDGPSGTALALADLAGVYPAAARASRSPHGDGAAYGDGAAHGGGPRGDRLLGDGSGHGGPRSAGGPAAYGDGTSYGDAIPHRDAIPHCDGAAYGDGAPHGDGPLGGGSVHGGPRSAAHGGGDPAACRDAHANPYGDRAPYDGAQPGRGRAPYDGPASHPAPPHPAVPAPADFVARVVAAAARRPAAGDHSLSRGEAGLLDFLQIAAADEPALLHRRAGALLAALDRFGPRCGTPDAVSSPGLLTGLAGIGHGLLRLGFDTRVPSVLLLRSPDRASTPASTRQLTRSREGDAR